MGWWDGGMVGCVDVCVWEFRHLVELRLSGDRCGGARHACVRSVVGCPGVWPCSARYGLGCVREVAEIPEIRVCGWVSFFFVVPWLFLSEPQNSGNLVVFSVPIYIRELINAALRVVRVWYLYDVLGAGSAGTRPSTRACRTLEGVFFSTGLGHKSLLCFVQMFGSSFAPSFNVYLCFCLFRSFSKTAGPCFVQVCLRFFFLALGEGW